MKGRIVRHSIIYRRTERNKVRENPEGDPRTRIANARSDIAEFRVWIARDRSTSG